MVVTSIERLLRNSSDSCKEIRRLYGYEGNIVFTDNKDQKVKTFNPLSATVETLLSTGHEGTVDGTEDGPAYAANNSGREPSCSLQLQKRDFHRSSVCSRLWNNFKGIFKENEVECEVLQT